MALWRAAISGNCTCLGIRQLSSNWMMMMMMMTSMIKQGEYNFDYDTYDYCSPHCHHPHVLASWQQQPPPGHLHNCLPLCIIVPTLLCIIVMPPDVIFCMQLYLHNSNATTAEHIFVALCGSRDGACVIFDQTTPTHYIVQQQQS